MLFGILFAIYYISGLICILCCHFQEGDVLTVRNFLFYLFMAIFWWLFLGVYVIYDKFLKNIWEKFLNIKLIKRK